MWLKFARFWPMFWPRHRFLAFPPCHAVAPLPTAKALSISLAGIVFDPPLRHRSELHPDLANIHITRVT
jgi:hypothetical protein